MTTATVARHRAGQDATLIGLVGLAHLISHFSQLLLPPLFPWLKDAFNVSYAELGLLMTIFFVVSCTVQFVSGFVVDRVGPRPVLFGGLGLLGCAAFGFALSQSYWMLALFAVVAGVGNGVFHPVDYTLLNRKVLPSRLGHAFSVHGITGNLGWALAPAMLVPLTLAFSWRVALAAPARWRSRCSRCCGSGARISTSRPAAPQPTGRRRAGGRRPVRVPEDSRGLDVLRVLLLLCDGAQRGADLRAGGRAAAAPGADRDLRRCA